MADDTETYGVVVVVIRLWRLQKLLRVSKVRKKLYTEKYILGIYTE